MAFTEVADTVSAVRVPIGETVELATTGPIVPNGTIHTAFVKSSEYVSRFCCTNELLFVHAAFSG
jgi:hypothetical protein